MKVIRRLREMAGSVAALVWKDGEEERIEIILAVENRMLRVGDRRVLLTAKQARIVSILLLPPMEVPKPTEILGGTDLGVDLSPGAVRKHISRLRLKFAEAGLALEIETLRGYGYYMRLNGESKVR